ncbi:DUF6671 family protein [Ectobacillus ponti]|uniref:DUF6671 domain-containing protein n=1 Tax=Ectobacillus ponti TaxID=2961894 RepID=A0AA41X7N2_9BACI|nr:DUF6671 family protein [Ectobacillus ponti]MCP8967793.1 hypothetical protein [Ectobacillus ponti]
MYNGVTAAFGTMHGKEEAVAPVFAELLGVEVYVPELDTDQFGTFSGEVPRRGTALEAAREKARLAMKKSGLALGLASEGSFGPHRSFPLVAEHHELLLWRDEERWLEIVEHHIGLDTNYSSGVLTAEELPAFLRQARFPSHAVMVKSGDFVRKGIRTEEALLAAFREAGGPVHVQTDMRAHMNPTRMEVLRVLAERLAHRLLQPCPDCSCPGWGLVRSVNGLPCESCRVPTPLVQYDVLGCGCCGKEQLRPRGTQASAMYCHICNP